MLGVCSMLWGWDSTAVLLDKLILESHIMKGRVWFVFSIKPEQLIRDAVFDVSFCCWG